MKQSWTQIVEDAIEYRHTLHRHPELTWQEKDTARSIREVLDRLSIPWRECAETGTVATLAANATGEHIALRADIDALPIHETTDAPWMSEVPGCMHACGHDGHTATLMAVAQWLKGHEAQLPGPVTLLFQPAEEGGHGAREMIAGGALNDVDAIYGWHNWPAIPFGQAICPDGAVMAANGTFEIFVRGQGGHASQPEQCRDPVLAASAITLALQQIVSRRLPPQAAAVVSVTSIDAPSGNTTIPDVAKLGGSIRLADPSLRSQLEALIVETAETTAKAYGVSAEAVMCPRYGATLNDPGAAQRMRNVIERELGSAWQSLETRIPVMASEDFSYYLGEIPGAFALIGANDGPAHAAPCHNANYDFNDALLPVAARILIAMTGAPLPKG